MSALNSCYIQRKFRIWALAGLGHPGSSVGTQLLKVASWAWCHKATSDLCPPFSGAGYSFQTHLLAVEQFSLIRKAKLDAKCPDCQQSTADGRSHRASLKHSAPLCSLLPHRRLTSSPSGGWAMVAAFLSINKSKLRRAVERQELFRAVKGDKAKANGLKQERQTIQDEKILAARSAEKHPRELLHWWVLLWEGQGEERGESMACVNTLWFRVQEINSLRPGILITTGRF